MAAALLARRHRGRGLAIGEHAPAGVAALLADHERYGGHTGVQSPAAPPEAPPGSTAARWLSPPADRTRAFAAIAWTTGMARAYRGAHVEPTREMAPQVGQNRAGTEECAAMLFARWGVV